MVFAVGSRNPVKLLAVSDAVNAFWPDAAVDGIAVESGVGDQPRSVEETFCGAATRARQALAARRDADFGVGIEGGISDEVDGMWAFAAAVVVSRDGRTGKGQTGRFLLPPEIARLIREEGLELGEADDRFFGRTNSKQNEGAVGILSKGRIDRRELYRHGILFALLRFVHEEHYPANS